MFDKNSFSLKQKLFKQTWRMSAQHTLELKKKFNKNIANQTGSKIFTRLS